MTKRDRKELVRYIRWVANEMNLRDWTITLEKEPCNEDLAGDCRCVTSQRHAIVAVNADFRNYNPDEQRETIVHELLHAHPRVVLADGPDGPAGAAREDRLLRVLRLLPASDGVHRRRAGQGDLAAPTAHQVAVSGSNGHARYERNVAHERAFTAAAASQIERSPMPITTLAEQRAPLEPIRDFPFRDLALDTLEELADARNYIAWLALRGEQVDPADPDLRAARSALQQALAHIIEAFAQVTLARSLTRLDGTRAEA